MPRPHSNDPSSVFVFGSVNIDLVCRVNSIARPGETVLSPRYEQLFGGKGANQAVAAARASSEGGRVSFVGAVGSDDLGVAATEQLKAEGIETGGLQIVSERTGCAFISIDARGENAITVASGANRLPEAARIDPSVFDDANILVLQMEVPLGESLAAARLMHAAGGRVVVNLAPVPGDLSRDDLTGLLSEADILVVNESELEAASALSEGAGSTVAEKAADLSRRFGLAVIATLGAEGVIVSQTDGTAQTIPALAVDVIDTTGAGDTFVGVLAVALSSGLSEAEAASRAAVAASLSCRKVGAQTAMPRAEEIEAALAGRP